MPALRTYEAGRNGELKVKPEIIHLSPRTDPELIAADSIHDVRNKRWKPKPGDPVVYKSYSLNHQPGLIFEYIGGSESHMEPNIVQIRPWGYEHTVRAWINEIRPATQKEMANWVAKRIREPDEEPPPKYRIGDILRYSGVETALLRVTSISPNHGALRRYYGDHYFGHSTAAYEIDCTIASPQDLELWKEHEIGLRNKTP
jgi:hypothetical protein